MIHALNAVFFATNMYLGIHYQREGERALCILNSVAAGLNMGALIVAGLLYWTRS